jgi:hypothetical protein
MSKINSSWNQEIHDWSALGRMLMVGVIQPIPLLSKDGQARSAGVVCSKSRSHLIDAREALLINRYGSTLNRPPQPSLREGIPALLRRGMGRVSLGQKSFKEERKIATRASGQLISYPAPSLFIHPS